MFKSLQESKRIGALLLAILFAVPFCLISPYFIEVPQSFLILASVLIFYILIGNLNLIKHTGLRTFYMIAAFLKVVLLIAMIHIKPGFLSGVDWANFNRYAIDAINSSSGLLELYANSLDLFVFLMALVYKVFGQFPDQIYLLIFACSLLVFRYMYKTARLIGASEKLSVVAGLALMLMPANVIYSVTLVREVSVQLVVSMSLYNFVRYLKLGKKPDAYKAGILALISALIHSGMIALFVAYLYVFVQGKVSRKKKIIALKALAGAGLLTTLLLISPLGGGVGARFANVGDVSAINNQYEFQLEASTTYISATTSSLGEFVLTAPYRFVMFALSPLPWQVNSLETAFSWAADGLLQLFIVVMLYRAWKRTKKSTVFLRNIVVTGLLAIGLVYLMFAMGTNNYGSAMRHRTKMLPVVVTVLIASDLAKQRMRLMKGDEI